MKLEYTFYDLDSGEILQWGAGEAVPPVPGPSVGVLPSLPPDPDTKYRIEAGEFVAVPEPAPDYRQRRQWHYPPLTDQIDALWHAMNDGLLPQVPGFYDQIAAVKAANPKE